MTYEYVIIDKIYCSSFIDWTYGENSELENRKALYKLHEKSALNVANKKRKILAITSITKREFEEDYLSNTQENYNVSSLIEASTEFNLLGNTEEASILKLASLLQFKKIKFCILTGNSLLLEKAQKEGFDTYDLKSVEEILKKV